MVNNFLQGLSVVQITGNICWSLTVCSLEEVKCAILSDVVLFGLFFASAASTWLHVIQTIRVQEIVGSVMITPVSEPMKWSHEHFR